MHDTQLDELLSSFFQCQIWKILVCGAQICDIVRWSDEWVFTGEMCPKNENEKLCLTSKSTEYIAVIFKFYSQLGLIFRKQSF